MTGAPEPVQRGDESDHVPTAGRGFRHGKHSLIAIITAVAVSVLVIVVPRALRNSPPSANLRGAALAVETRLRKSGKSTQAGETAQACASADCACARIAARHGLDADLASEVLALFEAVAKTCAAETSLPGLRAEALARADAGDRAKNEAEHVLAKEPENPHALYAVALYYHRAGRPADAAKYVERAIASGRGGQARLLAGLVAYQVGDFESAAREFQAVLELEPDNLDALYDLALVSQRRNRYRDAREGYLKVISLDPTRKDARFNLAMLAHSIGAHDEAKHHLTKLESIAPGDEKTEKLKAILAAPAAPGASAVPNFVGAVGAPAGGKDIAP